MEKPSTIISLILILPFMLKKGHLYGQNLNQPELNLQQKT